MINIQPYLDKLQRLNQYIALRIDDRLPTMIDYSISIEMAYNPALPPDTILQIYQATGSLYYRGDYQHSQHMRPMTFEEWYNR